MDMDDYRDRQGNRSIGRERPMTDSGNLPPPRAAAQQPQRKWSGLTCLLVVLVVVLAFGLLATAAIYQIAGGQCVALVEIQGLIQASGYDSLMGTSYGTNGILDQLRRAEEDRSVKAVVVWLDSPGGAPAASQAVYRRLVELGKKKPVIASMGDVAASGAYYIACGAQKIMASPGTETGSIGVIFSLFNVSDLLDKYGVSPLTIKSGPYKDMGSPFRPLRPDEQALLEGLINDIYEQFVADVAAGRKMPVSKVRRLADGRVYTGRQAKQLGLVDDLGSREDAIKLAARLGGIEGWPRLKQYAPVPTWLRRLVGAAAPIRPWYSALIERPGAWLTLPLPGAGMYLHPGLSR